MSRLPVLAALALGCAASLLLLVEAAGSTFEVCVLGAGPAGLQVSSFLSDAGVHNHVVLEQAARPGSFFERFPVHRRLLSLNKVYTGSGNEEFNLRHDWNTLLKPLHPEKGQRESVASFASKPWSKESYPHADELRAYLAEFAAKSVEKNVVRYDTQVYSVSRAQGDSYKANSFLVKYRSAGAQGEMVCEKLVVATGLARRVGLDENAGQGWSWLEKYGDYSSEGKDFRNQRVLIVGGGNSAFETAQVLSGWAAHVHVVSRAPPKYAHATHYVGDVRAVNDHLLDTYQLKSLDAIIDTGVSVASFFDLRRCDAEVDAFGRASKNITYHDGGKLFCAVPKGINNPNDLTEWPLTNRLVGFRQPFERVLSAMGFAFDDAVFEGEARPLARAMRQANEAKFPAQTCRYESVNVPNMYFAGALSHSRDYKRASGGFIQGFRYQALALVRFLVRERAGQDRGVPASLEDLLDQKPFVAEEAVQRPWPLKGEETTALSAEALADRVLQRLATASGLYHSNGETADVFLISRDGQQVRHLFDVPRCACANPMDERMRMNWVANTFAPHLRTLHDVPDLSYRAMDEINGIELPQEDDLASRLPTYLVTLGSQEKKDERQADIESEAPLGSRGRFTRAYWKGDARSCELCDDAHHRFVVSFKTREDYHGLGATLGADRVGARTVVEAHKSKFMHPFVEFIPAAGSGLAASAHHVLESVNMAWNSESLHRRPLIQYFANVTGMVMECTKKA